jgi:DNA-binding NarL/FixJ family response regulator
MQTPMRILLADDHVLVRKGMAALIASREDMQVVGEASDGLEAIALARETCPDVVLLDIHMPRCNGLEAIPHILRNAPEARIVMLTVSDEDRDLFTALKSGAFGYLLKDIEPQQLFFMLEGIRRGEVPISGAMATKILREFRHQEPAAMLPDPSHPLTAREAQVLKLIAQGATNREIATTLSIAETTAKMHLRNILEKLHLQNRIQAAAYAVRQGLVDPPDSTSSTGTEK